MKVRLNEGTLNLYIAEAIKRELNEDGWRNMFKKWQNFKASLIGPGVRTVGGFANGLVGNTWSQAFKDVNSSLFFRGGTLAGRMAKNISQINLLKILRTNSAKKNALAALEEAKVNLATERNNTVMGVLMNAIKSVQKEEVVTVPEFIDTLQELVRGDLAEKVSSLTVEEFGSVIGDVFPKFKEFCVKYCEEAAESFNKMNAANKTGIPRYRFGLPGKGDMSVKELETLAVESEKNLRELAIEYCTTIAAAFVGGVTTYFTARGRRRKKDNQMRQRATDAYTRRMQSGESNMSDQQARTNAESQIDWGDD